MKRNVIPRIKAWELTNTYAVDWLPLDENWKTIHISGFNFKEAMYNFLKSGYFWYWVDQNISPEIVIQHGSMDNPMYKYSVKEIEIAAQTHEA